MSSACFLLTISYICCVCDYRLQGPGCSGLLGFFSEMGPFRPNREGGLDANPYSWNQRANMVFIESPEGVGFSHSVADIEYADDRSTAKTNHKLINLFFERYPEFQTNDLYLASESYGKDLNNFLLAKC